MVILVKDSPVVCSACSGHGIVGFYSGNPPEPDSQTCRNCDGFGIELHESIWDDAAHEFYGLYSNLSPRLKAKLSLDDLVNIWQRMGRPVAHKLIRNSIEWALMENRNENAN